MEDLSMTDVIGVGRGRCSAEGTVRMRLMVTTSGVGAASCDGNNYRQSWVRLRPPPHIDKGGARRRGTGRVERKEDIGKSG